MKWEGKQQRFGTQSKTRQDTTGESKISGLFPADDSQAVLTRGATYYRFCGQWVKKYRVWYKIRPLCLETWVGSLQVFDRRRRYALSGT